MPRDRDRSRQSGMIPINAEAFEIEDNSSGSDLPQHDRVPLLKEQFDKVRLCLERIWQVRLMICVNCLAVIVRL